ncbi:MAG: hypothetical protein IPF58_02430 [Saprospirales bacterium]|nr:hypothetical protein [Saprospirales bacterium]
MGFNLGEIPMWNSATGDTIYEIKRNGLDYNAIEVTVSDSYLVNKGITWKQNMLFGNSNVSQDTAHFLIDALGEIAMFYIKILELRLPYYVILVRDLIKMLVLTTWDLKLLLYFLNQKE